MRNQTIACRFQGFPPVKPAFNESLIEECVKLTKEWSELSIDELKNKNASEFEAMSTKKKTKVLNLIHQTGFLILLCRH